MYVANPMHPGTTKMMPVLVPFFKYWGENKGREIKLIKQRFLGLSIFHKIHINLTRPLIKTCMPRLNTNNTLSWETISERARFLALSIFHKIHLNLTQPLIKTCMPGLNTNNTLS